ncbi:MAG: hypothetical protein U5N85_02450 [Arcicella sp.]|nr:hypothetical protein [Arcicella sp.]
MKKTLILTVAAVALLNFSNLCFAQNTKIRTNKEISFEVSLNPSNKTILKWLSSEGHQTSRFIIQRSKDNETYFDIREIDVQPQGDSEQRFQFTFTDSKTLRGTEYYRIMEYETDGKSYTYSALSIKPESPISVAKAGEMSVIRVMVEDSKNLTALMSTESGLGVPCEFEISDNNDVILKPAYALNGGNYMVKLRSSTGEKQFRFSVKSDDLL